jgi:hypothetical protein
MTISDNEIDVSSGNLTLDVNGDITLSADAESIYFNDGAVKHLIFMMDTNNETTIRAHDGVSFEVLRIEGAKIELNATVGDLIITSGMSNVEALTFDLDGTADQIDIQLKVDGDDLVFKQYDGNEVVRFTHEGDVKVTNTVYFADETDNACDSSGGSASSTIDWNVSQKQNLTITGTDNTIDFTNPAGPCNLILKIIQGDGDDTITAGNYHTNVKWAGGAKPTLSTTNGAIDIVSFYFDGTSYHGVGSIGFATV